MPNPLQKITSGIQKRVRGTAFLSKCSPEERSLISRIQISKLTYLSEAKLASIALTCRMIETKGIPGVFIEAGCALGGSTILIASTKKGERSFNVYDVFGMIPAPTTDDSQDVHERYRTIVEGKSKGIGDDLYYGYMDNLYKVVQKNLSDFGIDQEKQSVNLIKGLVQETMNLDQPVAFAHIDVDWFDPVLYCLKQIFPRLSPGGCLILDDYHDWGGCHKATDMYLQEVAGQYSLDDSAGSLKITRI